MNQDSALTTAELRSLCEEDSEMWLPEGVHASVFFQCMALARDWTVRRVLNHKLRPDGCNYFHVTLDVVVPRALIAHGAEAGSLALVPISWWKKDLRPHQIDIRDASGTALPLAHSSTQLELALRATLSMIAASNHKVTSVQVELLRGQIANLVVESPVIAYRHWLDACSTLQLMTSDELVVHRVTGFLRKFVEEHLVAVWVEVRHVGRAQSIKYNYGLGSAEVGTLDKPKIWSRHPGPLKALGQRLGLTGARWLVHPRLELDDTDVFSAQSTHFEIGVTGEVLVARVEVEPSQLARVEADMRPSAIATIAFRTPDLAEPSPSSRALLKISLRPKKSLTTDSAKVVPRIAFALVTLVCGVSQLLYWLQDEATVRALRDWGMEPTLLSIADAINPPDLMNSTQLVLALATFGSLGLTRPSEHAVTAFVLNPFRRITVGSTFVLGAASISTALLQPHLWWLALSPIVIVLGYFISRFETLQVHIARRGEKSLNENSNNKDSVTVVAYGDTRTGDR